MTAAAVRLAVLLLPMLIIARPAWAADEDPVTAELVRHAEAAGVTVGVSAVHLESGRRIRINADQAFPLASTYKVPMAAYALYLVGQGRLDPDALIEVRPEDKVISSPITRLFPHPGIRLSLLNLMEAMLIRSDNTATDVLLRTVGGGPAVTRWLASRGIDDLRVDRSTADLIRDYMGMPRVAGSMAEQYEAENFDDLTEADWRAFYDALLADPRDQGTPDAMTKLLTGIWQDAYLDARYGEALRAIMGRCLTGGARLSGRMPGHELPLAHKTGSLGGTINDVGVMTLPGGAGTVVLSVFTRGSSYMDAEAGEAVIADTGRTVYDYFLLTGR
ncbi:MAG: class A beta-lactamase-related serine hydrolase [Pseudomonadales bacterium]|jgi:beta-lactamase class A